jgi:hypothetical protein
MIPRIRVQTGTAVSPILVPAALYAAIPPTVFGRIRQNHRIGIIAPFHARRKCILGGYKAHPELARPFPRSVGCSTTRSEALRRVGKANYRSELENFYRPLTSVGIRNQLRWPAAPIFSAYAPFEQQRGIAPLRSG